MPTADDRETTVGTSWQTHHHLYLAAYRQFYHNLTRHHRDFTVFTPTGEWNHLHSQAFHGYMGSYLNTTMCLLRLETL